VIVTKTNMIDGMPCAYGTLRVASGPICILLMYLMTPFRRMVAVGHNATMFLYNRIPTDWEETAKLLSKGGMQCDASYWRRARSSLPPGCLWWLWWSASTLTQPLRPHGNVFCWWSMLVTLTTWCSGRIETVRKITFATRYICKGPPCRGNSNIQYVPKPKSQPSSSRNWWG